MSGFGGPPPGGSVFQHYLNMAIRAPPPPPTYQGLNTAESQKSATWPPPFDAVPGGCWIGDSDRNRDTIFEFISGEGNDELEVVVFLAGHAGMINPHQSAGEPTFPIGCYTCYFNYAGESSFSPGSAHSTSDAFGSMLSPLMINPLNKKGFFGFLENFKQAHITSGSPLSLYKPSTQMDDSNVLCNGGVAQEDIDFVPQLGKYIFPRNPASALIYVKQAHGTQVFDLTTLNPAIINMWHHNGGDLNVHPTADGRGFQFDIAPYQYRNHDGTIRNVRLSDIYELIKVVVRHIRPATTFEPDMDEFMHRHAVLVSLGCRVLGNGTVHRVQSVPRPDSVSPESFASGASGEMDEGGVADLHKRGFSHWPLPTLGSGSSVSVPRPDGGKKKQRRRQTRNRNKKGLSKRSKKHSSKRR